MWSEALSVMARQNLLTEARLLVCPSGIHQGLTEDVGRTETLRILDLEGQRGSTEDLRP